MADAQSAEEHEMCLVAYQPSQHGNWGGQKYIKQDCGNNAGEPEVVMISCPALPISNN